MSLVKGDHKGSQLEPEAARRMANGKLRALQSEPKRLNKITCLFIYTYSKVAASAAVPSSSLACNMLSPRLPGWLAGRQDGIL